MANAKKTANAVKNPKQPKENIKPEVTPGNTNKTEVKPAKANKPEVKTGNTNKPVVKKQTPIERIELRKGWDPKCRLVFLYQEGDKFRVTKPSKNFDSGLVTRAKADEQYAKLRREYY